MDGKNFLKGNIINTYGVMQMSIIDNLKKKIRKLRERLKSRTLLQPKRTTSPRRSRTTHYGSRPRTQRGLDNVISSMMNGEYENAMSYPGKVLQSAGIKKTEEINTERLEDELVDKMGEYSDKIYNDMMAVLNKNGLSEAQGVTLLLWQVSGDLREPRLEKYGDVASQLGTILWDGISNWTVSAVKSAVK